MIPAQRLLPRLIEFALLVVPFVPLCASADGPAQLPQLPLAFEPNAGQTDSHVKYLAHAPHATVWLTEQGAVLGLGNKAVEMRFEGANPHPRIAAEDREPGVSNYYVGNDRSKWRSGVPHYGRVRYSGIYPGIHAVFYGNPTDLEYDFVVDTGADPSQIRLAFRGTGQVTVDSSGALVLKTEDATIRNLRPVVTQDGKQVHGQWVLRGQHSAGFVVDSFDHSKKLTIDPILSYATYLGGTSYDAVGGVAIDAQGNIVVGSTTASSDFPLANAFDSSLAVPTQGYIVASPSEPQIVTAVFSRINPSASGAAQLIYSTFYSSAGLALAGSTVSAAAVDSAGNAYFTGSAGDNLPLVNPLPNQSTYRNNGACAQTDNNQNGACSHAYVAEVSPTGSLLFSTYLGGSAADTPSGLAVDTAGNIYVCGATLSIDFPLTSNAVPTTASSQWSAGFVTMISGPVSNRTIQYSTLLSAQGNTAAYGIATDATGNIYAAGEADAGGFPVTSNALRSSFPNQTSAFAVVLNPTAKPSMTYGTLLGATDGMTVGDAVATDGKGNIILGGWTTAPTFPQTGVPETISAAVGFVSRINPAATGSAQLTWSGILGSGAPAGYLGPGVMSVLLDPAGHVWVGGQTTATISTTSNALQPWPASFTQGDKPTKRLFVAELDLTQPPASSTLYGSYLGGTDAFFSQMALDPAGKTLLVGAGVDMIGSTTTPLAGVFGGAGGVTTWQGNLSYAPGPPITAKAYQPAQKGAGDGYIALFDLTQSGPLMTTMLNSATLGAQTQLFLSPGLIFSIFGTGLGPASPAGGTISGGVVANNVAGVQVFVDGQPSPLLYVSATQINAIVPYATAAKVTAAGAGVVPVQVFFNGVPGNVIYTPVMATNPGLFSYGWGAGQGAILNQDGSLNGPGNPAARGTIAVFFATGEGQTNPAGADGALADQPLGSIPAPVAPVTMTIGGVSVTDFTYIGTAPGGVAGALQINATIPTSVAPGASVPVVLTIGSNSSPQTVTMAVQ